MSISSTNDKDLVQSVSRFLIGKPLPSHEAAHQTINKKVGLAVFASDALSSTAYATEAILEVLAFAIPVAGALVLGYSLWVERRETAIEDELNTYADLDFDARVSAYVQNLQADLEDVINAKPQNEEERHQLFLRKRRYINDLLEEVVIDGDRQIHVKFRADILHLVQGNKVA